MTKVAYNTCYGSFSLSHEAVLRGCELSGNPQWGGCDVSRTDPVLIQVIEELGEKANGMWACLAIDEVPSGRKYRIDNYDGNELVMTIEDYDWLTA